MEALPRCAASNGRPRPRHLVTLSPSAKVYLWRLNPQPWHPDSSCGRLHLRRPSPAPGAEPGNRQAPLRPPGAESVAEDGRETRLPGPGLAPSLVRSVFGLRTAGPALPADAQAAWHGNCTPLVGVKPGRRLLRRPPCTSRVRARSPVPRSRLLSSIGPASTSAVSARERYMGHVQWTTQRCARLPSCSPVSTTTQPLKCAGK